MKREERYENEGRKIDVDKKLSENGGPGEAAMEINRIEREMDREKEN